VSGLAKKSFRILLGRGSVAVLSILFTIYFAHEFPKPIFAFIALYETAVSLSRVVVDFGLHVRIIREAPPLMHGGKTDEAFSRIVLPDSVVRLTGAVVVSVAFYAVMLILEPWLRTQVGELNFSYVALICGFHMLLTDIETITTTIFAIRQRFGSDAFLESAAGLLENILALICYLAWGTEHYFTGILLGITLMVALRFYLIRDTFRFWNARHLTLTGSMTALKTYFPFYLRKFVRIGFVQGEQLLIPFLLPLNQLANFKLAKRCSGFLKNYTQAFSDPLMIKMSKSRDIKHRRDYGKTFLLFTVPIPLILVFASPWIMEWVGGKKYAESWPILMILYASYVFYAVSQLQLTVLTVFGKPMEFLLRDTVAGVIGLVSTFGLILVFQENGIAWGQLISYITLSIIGYRLSKKYILDSIPLPIQRSWPDG
jgi:O-antigen/teichoic acid export membrane protein